MTRKYIKKSTLLVHYYTSKVTSHPTVYHMQLSANNQQYVQIKSKK